MKIVSLNAYPLSAALDGSYSGGNFLFTTARLILVKIETDEGIVGLATLHGHAMKQVCELLRSLENLIKGQDPLEHEAIWQKIFSISTTPPGKPGLPVSRELFSNDKFPLLMRCLAGIDIALWDIKGKALGLPVWKLLGAGRQRLPAYVTGGYYRSGSDNMQFHGELAGYVEEGFSTVKIKIGALSIEEDLQRVARAREEIGPQCGLILDANNAYSWQDARRAIELFEEFDILWFEEPVHWYDSVRGLGRLAASTRVPLSSGESEIHGWACRDLVDLGRVQVMQFDATRAGGATEWLRVASYCHLHGVTMSTHHEAHIQCHLLAAASNGGLAETFSQSARDPFWDELYTCRAELRDGEIWLNDKPGFGFDVDWKVVQKYLV